MKISTSMASYQQSNSGISASGASEHSVGSERAEEESGGEKETRIKAFIPRVRIWRKQLRLGKGVITPSW